MTPRGTGRTHERRWWRRALLACLAFWAAFSALSVVNTPGSLVRLLRDDVGYTAIVFVAVCTSLAARRRAPLSRRRFWTAMLTSNVTWFVAEVYWGAADALSIDVPSPSVGDALLIVSYLCLLVAVGFGFSGAGRASVWRSQLDGVIVCIAVAVAGWQLLVAPQLGDGIDAESLTLAVYPVLDIAFFVVFVSIGLAGNRRMPRPVLAVVVGICFSLVGDVLLTILSLHGQDIFDGLTKCIYLPAALLPIAGALADSRSGNEESSELRSVEVDLGILPTVLAVGSVLAWALLDGTARTVGLAPFIVTVVLLVALAARVQLSARVVRGALQNLDSALDEQRRLAGSDGLTGLRNRRYAEDAYPDLLRAAVAAAPERQMLVVILDLDHFKSVNDVHGHAAGDIVLSTVAERLSSVLRASDVLARWGGEEFLALLPLVPATDVVAVVERLRLALSITPIDVGTGTALRVTASLGAVRVPLEASDLPDALRLADASLYEAKAAGRDQARFSAPVQDAAGGSPAAHSVATGEELVTVASTGPDRKDTPGR